MFRVSYLKDVLGNNYLGIKIEREFISQYLDKLRDILGEDYEKYTQNQQQRDRGFYHITLMNVMEYNKLSSTMGIDKFINSLENIFDHQFDDLQFWGIGRAQKNENCAYFIVVKSEQLSEVRKIWGLVEHDFHITIGFDKKDVFGVRKNEIISENSNFLKLISRLYYENSESFNFIKDLKEYDYDKELELDVVKLNQTSITFRVGFNDYFCVTLPEENLTITNKWEDTKRLPIISNTLLDKKLLKKNFR